MDSFSTFCIAEFEHLPMPQQEQEIGKLFVLLGGIEITKYRDEDDQDFRIRAFTKGLRELPSNSEFKRNFFENRMIPSLIEDFEDLSDTKQEWLLDQLYTLTGRSVTKRSGETELSFRIRSYSRLLPKLEPGSEYEAVEFAWKLLDDSDDLSADEEYSRGRQLKSTSFAPGYKTKDGKASSSKPQRSRSAEGDGYDTQPVSVAEWNDGSKTGGFNSTLQPKADTSKKTTRRRPVI